MPSYNKWISWKEIIMTDHIFFKICSTRYTVCTKITNMQEFMKPNG